MFISMYASLAKGSQMQFAVTRLNFIYFYCLYVLFPKMTAPLDLLLIIPCSIFNAVLPVGFYKVVRQEAGAPFHVIQTCIILEDTAAFIDSAHGWVAHCMDYDGDVASIHPQLLRFLTHLILFFRMIGVSLDVSVFLDYSFNKNCTKLF